MRISELNFSNLLAAHQWVWGRIIHASELPCGALRSLRVLLPAVYLLLYLPSYNWIAQMPDAWFDPPPLSIAAGFRAFPSLLFFQVAQTLLILSATALMLGKRPRLFGLAFCAIHVVITSFEYSFGKIDHGAHFLMLCFFCLSLDNWGTKEPRSSLALPIPGSTLLAVLIAFGMFTAGFDKTLRWFDFNLNTNGFLTWFVPGHHNLGRDELLAPYITSLPKIILEFLDYSGALFEMVPFLFLLCGKRYWIAWCATACLFHAGILVMVNISFKYQMFGYMPFLLPVLSLPQFQSHAKKIASVILAIAAYRIATVWIEGCPILRDAMLPSELIKLYFDLLVLLGCAAIGYYNALLCKPLRWGWKG